MFALLFAAIGLTLPATAGADDGCREGVYGTAGDGFVVIGPAPPRPGAPRRFLLLDGRRGNVNDADGAVVCNDGVARFTLADGAVVRAPRMPTKEQGGVFESAGTALTGQLIEPPGDTSPARPLVVLVHGSEKSSAIGSVYAYMLVAQGIAVFVYDKRGTGASGGEYTQNFELLADDAAAALAQARKMARGRFTRAGFFGGSQGGWVAPLAATRSTADFVAVGFGLVASPIDEDREQMLSEARAADLGAKERAQITRLSRATATLLRSHFTRGFENLERVKREIGNAAWARTIQGEHSGAMLRMGAAELRRIGRARFDNLELIWDYDAPATLRKLSVPLLWVLAGDDREAPIESTRGKLLELSASGQRIDLYLFPQTDHGMVEYTTDATGARVPTRITEGYLRLLADWIKGEGVGPYGRCETLAPKARANAPCGR